MTVLMITIWLALQIPAGTLLGHMLQREPALVPVWTGRRARR
jgi:hypothetical protein